MCSQQNVSSSVEKRKHPRINTSNEVDYILLDKNNEKIGHGKGKTRNLSQSGTLLETRAPLKGSFVILVTFDLEGNKVQVKGHLVHTNEADKPGWYLSGINFSGSREENINAIVAFVKTYYRRKYSEVQE